MTPLEETLCARIARVGPITLAEYMTEALYHPDHGYYTTGQPLGRDFTTAPEISQMFGELVGLALAQAWLDQGAPRNAVLAEIGPGRGTLMADALRATRGVPGFHDAVRVHLVEVSPSLRAEQARRVPGATFHDHLSDLPEAPLFLVANELFDALPLRQFLRDGDGWRERMVGLVDGALGFALGPRTRLAALEPRLADTGDGDAVTLCPAAEALAEEIARRVGSHGGAALLIDYGDDRPRGDTVQALRAGQKVDPLDGPGTADLTAHVDFEALRTAARPHAAVSRTTPQGVWLERLGITPRAQALARGLTGAALETHVAAHRRLTHPQEMGTLFKVMGLKPASAPDLPGLEFGTGAP